MSSSFFDIEMTIGGLVSSWSKASMAAWSWPMPPSIKMTSG